MYFAFFFIIQFQGERRARILMRLSMESKEICSSFYFIFRIADFFFDVVIAVCIFFYPFLCFCIFLWNHFRFLFIFFHTDKCVAGKDRSLSLPPLCSVWIYNKKINMQKNWNINQLSQCNDSHFAKSKQAPSPQSWTGVMPIPLHP